MHDPQPDSVPSGHVLGVVGASGGLGASTLVCALARRWSDRGGLSVGVDADLFAGHLDVTACLEHVPGLRWADLAQARGGLDGARLVRQLPREEGPPVLGGAAAGPVESLLSSALGGLAQAVGLVAVDVGRSEPALQAVLPRCDAVVILAGLTVRQLADADVVIGRVLQRCPDGWLVTRGTRARDELSDAVAAHVDLPLAAHWAADPHVVRDAERGSAPAAHGRSRLAALADRVLDCALSPAREGAGLPLGLESGEPGPGSARRTHRRGSGEPGSGSPGLSQRVPGPW